MSLFQEAESENANISEEDGNNFGRSSPGAFHCAAGRGPTSAAKPAAQLHFARIQCRTSGSRRERSTGSNQKTRRVRHAVSQLHAHGVHLSVLLSDVLPAKELPQGH